MKNTAAAAALLGVGLWLLMVTPPAMARPMTNSTNVNEPAKNHGMTDKEVFQALDLTLPGLAPVKKAVDAGDTAGAKKALAAYLRARTSVPWTFDPHRIDRSIPYSKEAAEDAVNANVRVVTIPHTFPGGAIDWFYNVTTAREDLPDNNEWQWQLNRMHFWRALGSAYWGTGDERYARAWVRQLRSWIKGAPQPAEKSNGARSAWRTIETGIRLAGSWPEAYHRFLMSPSFTDEDVLLYLKSSWEQARYLRKYPSTGNWLTMEMSGLYTTAALFPELKEAAEWRRFAAERLYAELNTQFLPDGAQVELTPGYHQVALDNVLKIPEVARRVGRMNELPADFVARAERAFDFNLYLMTPDRDLPRFNDSWPVNVVGSMKKAAEFFPKRADFAWIATESRQGKPPATTSHAFPYAGYFVMRSGWERDADYAVLDAGPLGYGHVHQDKLNLVVWAQGREILFDGGGGSYERSKWRSFATDTFGHNTVLVDNKPQRRQTKDREANVSKAPIDAGWESTRAHDFATGTYNEGYGTEDDRPAAHTRRVLFVKPDSQAGAAFYVVSDMLTPRDTAATHTYQARWHLLTTVPQTDPATSTVFTTDTGKPNLAVVPLLVSGLETRAASAQTEPELLGWHVRKDMDPQYVPATTLLHMKKGAGVQRFLTLLVPLKPGQGNPVRAVRATGLASAEVTFTDGRVLAVSDDPGRGLSVIETLPGGRSGRAITAGATAAAR